MIYRVNKRANIFLLKIPGGWQNMRVGGRTWRERATYKPQFSRIKKGVIVEMVSIEGAIEYEWPLVRSASGRRFYIDPRNLDEITPLEALAREAE